MIGGAALALAAAIGAAPAPPAIEIASDSSCPSAGMVRAALVTVGGEASQRRAAVTVRAAPDVMVLAFQWEGEGPAETRAVPAPTGCEQRARAAAVVIASWLGTLPAAPVTAPPGRRDAALATRPAAPAPLVPSVLQPDASPPPPAATSLGPLPAAEAGSWWFGLGLGAGVGGGIVPGLRVELARAGSWRRGAGWLVAAQATMPRSQSVGDGTSRWLRPALGLAAFFAWPMGAGVASVDLGPVAAATLAWGSGYPTDKTDQALSMGASVGARMQLGTGPSRPWVELRGTQWLSSQRLRFDSPDGVAVTAELPRTEGFLTLGWSLPIR